jgi:hypothetical protein
MNRRITTAILLTFLLAWTLPACGDGDAGDVADKIKEGAKDAADAADDAAKDIADDDDDAVTVESITLMNDNEGDAGKVVDGFKTTDQAFHADVKLSEMGSGSKVKGELVAVKTSEGDNIPVVSEEKEVGGLNNSVDFTFSLPKPWPAGSYRVDVYLDGVKASSKDFEITE